MLPQLTYGCMVRETRVTCFRMILMTQMSLGKALGVLKVRACWHDIVFRNEFGFTESMFLYS